MFTNAITNRSVRERGSSATVVRRSSPVYDHFDGKEYPTCQVGGQQWLAVNVDREAPAGWRPEDDRYAATGRVYSWGEASWLGGTFGEDWRLPEQADWLTLLSTLNSVADYTHLELARGHWRGWLGNAHCSLWRCIYWSATVDEDGRPYASAFPLNFGTAPKDTLPFEGYCGNAYAVRLMRRC